MTARTSPRLLAAGIVVLEFSTATTVFVTSTLLPILVPDLHATAHVGWMLAAPTIGLFTAMPIAGRLASAWSARAVLIIGLILTATGAALSAMAHDAGAFSLGRWVVGIASALLAVNGLAAAIEYLDEGLRRTVLALSALMWVLPGSIGPALVLLANQAWGWRVTVVIPAAILAAAQIVISWASPRHGGSLPSDPSPILTRAFLVPFGVGLFLLAPFATVRVAGLFLSLPGFAAVVPPGTLRARVGAPAAVLTLTLFTVSYAGVDSVYTLFVTRALGGSITFAGVSLGLAAVAWALAQIATERVPFLAPAQRHSSAALVVISSLIAAMAVTAARAGEPALGGVAWIAAGLAVGVFYPTMYLRATTATAGLDAAALAAAAISAEAYGALLGSAVSGALIQLPALTPVEHAPFVAIHLLAALIGLAAAFTAKRTSAQSAMPLAHGQSGQPG